MSKLIALAAACALVAGGAAAHPGHDGGQVVEKRVCMIKKPGDAAAKEVPCDSVDHGMGDHDMMGAHGPHAGGHHGMMLKMHGGPEGLDANKDGRVSFEELAAPLREHFNEMDKNKSGFLEKDEMPNHGAMIVEKRIEKSE